MRRVIATEWMSLDGVVQSPSAPDEDSSGNFDRGGWHPRYFDEVSMQRVVDTVTGAGAYLLGRGTFEIFAAHWPAAPEDQRMLAEPLNTRPKYVASTMLSEPLAWQHSTLLQGDLAAAVAALKKEDGGDLLVIGSPQVVQTLLEHGLLDELRVMIDPVVIGRGKRLFATDGPLRHLRLASGQVTSTGAILATYVPGVD